MNPAASGARDDEDAARALLHQYVADIQSAADLIDRVEDGVRRRRKARRRVVVPGTVLATAACVAAVVFTMEKMAAPARHAAQGGQAVITCPVPLPTGWLNAGVPATPPVSGAPRALLPGTPVAAVSCSTGDSAHSTTTSLTAQQVSAMVAALRTAPVDSGAAAVNQPCETGDQHHQPLYLIFGYADGTRLTITAYAQTLCTGYGPVSWYASNGQVRTTAFQSAVLDSFSASPAAGTASSASVASSG